MDYNITPGDTSVSITMYLQDPVTLGPNTGLTIANLDMSYCRPGSADVKNDAVALAAVDSAYAAGKMIEIDSTNHKGWYRADWADAAYAAGVPMVSLEILDTNGTVINASTAQLRTSAPSAAAIVNEWETQSQADPTGFHVNVKELDGSAIQQASGYTKISNGTGTGQVTLSSGTVTVGTNNDKTGYTLTNISDANMAKLEDMLDGTGATLTLSNDLAVDMVKIHGSALTETSGQLAGAFTKFFNVATPTGTVDSIPDAVAGAAGGLFIAGTNAETTITTALNANVIGNITGNLTGDIAGAITGNITGNLSGSVGSVTGAVGSVATGGIVAATFAADAITATVIATDAIDADALAADAVAKLAAASQSITVEGTMIVGEGASA